ncbi:nuclear transport factor 2 family protein [Pedomonas sp. V897]|jgi:Ketosteroid isomerase homolog|uniref:nuclear transport factor 2 family protein n=1 Tax=Pedomonas sp. V897 TaxID=3446482 RepID=UPI003EE1DA0D
MVWTGPLEDRILIRELLDSYADAVSQRDAEAWGATWAEDSVWSLPVVEGMSEIRGKANIVAAWKQAMELFPFVQMIAVPGSIDIQGDRAYMRSYTAEVAVRDGKEIRPRGQYDDVCVKQNGKWLFEKRVFTVLYGE